MWKLSKIHRVITVFWTLCLFLVLIVSPCSRAQVLSLEIDVGNVVAVLDDFHNVGNYSNTAHGVIWIDHPSLGFSISSTEITTRTFSKCIDAGVCTPGNVDFRDHRPGCTLTMDEESEFQDYPINCVNYYGAEQLCAWLGGNICSESSWNSACGWKGENKKLSIYPYGDQFEEDRCLVGAYEDKKKLEPIHSRLECEGGLPGLYDMGGSLSEWLSDGTGTYRKFKPISYAFNGPRSKPPCSNMCAGNQMDFKTTSVGIRCCRPLESLTIAHTSNNNGTESHDIL